MKIILATWLEEINQKKALDKIKAYNRLLSYYFLSKRDRPGKELKKYIKNI